MAFPGFDYNLHEVQISAKHIIDVTDIAKYICKAKDFTANVTSYIAGVDTTPATLAVEGTFSDCTQIKAGPGGIMGLIIAIVQSGVLCVLGPAITLYGPTMPRFTSLVQAVIVSSYILLINSIASVSAFTAFLVFERTVTLVISTLTVTYASLNNKGAKAKAAGFALGTLVATPLMAFLSEMLYKVPGIGCTGFDVSQKKEYFPNGTPTGCELNSWEFQMVFQLTLLMKWCIIATSAYYGKKTMNFSTSTAGATMIVKGVIDLAKAVGFQVAPEIAGPVVAVVTPVRTWVTYGVAVGGFLLQRKLITLTEEPPKEEGGEPTKKYVISDSQPKCMNVLCGVVLKLCYSIDAFLGRHLETLKDGGKAALVRQLTRKVSSKPKETKEADIKVTVDAKDEATTAKPIKDADIQA